MSNRWDDTDFNARPSEEIQAGAERLARLLTKYSGTHKQKVRWLEYELPVLMAEATKETGQLEGRRFNGALISLTIRWWRWRLRRKGLPIVDEKPQEEGRRGQELTLIRSVVDDGEK
jgi:hypothetical protein